MILVKWKFILSRIHICIISMIHKSCHRESRTVKTGSSELGVSNFNDSRQRWWQHLLNNFVGELLSKEKDIRNPRRECNTQTLRFAYESELSRSIYSLKRTASRREAKLKKRRKKNRDMKRERALYVDSVCRLYSRVFFVHVTIRLSSFEAFACTGRNFQKQLQFKPLTRNFKLPKNENGASSEKHEGGYKTNRETFETFRNKIYKAYVRQLWITLQTTCHRSEFPIYSCR